MLGFVGLEIGTLGSVVTVLTFIINVDLKLFVDCYRGGAIVGKQ